jgi:hypothetical protein
MLECVGRPNDCRIDNVDASCQTVWARYGLAGTTSYRMSCRHCNQTCAVSNRHCSLCRTGKAEATSRRDNCNQTGNSFDLARVGSVPFLASGSWPAVITGPVSTCTTAGLDIHKGYATPVAPAVGVDPGCQMQGIHICARPSSWAKTTQKAGVNVHRREAHLFPPSTS